MQLSRGWLLDPIVYVEKEFNLGLRMGLGIFEDSIAFDSPLCAEGASTTTAARRVRVVEDKAAAHDLVLEVDRCAV